MNVVSASCLWKNNRIKISVHFNSVFQNILLHHLVNEVAFLIFLKKLALRMLGKYVSTLYIPNISVIIQGAPVNRAIWQQRFSIFSVSREGE